MPTRDREKNPLAVGDVVTMAMDNGAGEGVLWRVYKITGHDYVHLEALWTVTGPSVLRPKKVHWRNVDVPDVLHLCTARAQLDTIIQELVKRKSGTPYAPQDCCGTCGYDVDECRCKR